MITASDIITVTFTPEEMERIHYHAEKATLNGRSEIYAGQQRKAEGPQNQETGQLCEAAISVYYSDSIQWYDLTREERNKNPRKTDDGYDLLGFAVDVKGRGYDAKWILRSDFLCQPKEKRDNWYYISAAAPKGGNVAYLIGWLTTDMFPDKPTLIPGFEKPTFQVSNRLLNPLQPSSFARLQHGAPIQR